MGRPRKTAANDPMVARAVQLSAEGLSSAVIAVRLGTSRKNVDAWLRRAREEGEGAGDTPPRGIRRGQVPQGVQAPRGGAADHDRMGVLR